MKSWIQANVRPRPARSMSGPALACLLYACGSAHRPTPPQPASGERPAHSQSTVTDGEGKPLSVGSQTGGVRAAAFPVDRDAPGRVSPTSVSRVDLPQAGAAASDQDRSAQVDPVHMLGVQPARESVAAPQLRVQLRRSGLAFELTARGDPHAQQVLKSVNTVAVRIEGERHSRTSLLPADAAGRVPLTALDGSALPDGHYRYEVAPQLPPISGAAPERPVVRGDYADRPLRQALRARARALPEPSVEPVLDADGRNARDPRVAARKAAPLLPSARGSFSIVAGALALDDAEPVAPPVESQALHRPTVETTLGTP